MTKTRLEKRRLESVGVSKALQFLHLKRRQGYNHPFDIVNSTHGIEVKAISHDAKDMKIHISPESLQRKLDYATKHGKDTLLIAVVLNPKSKADIYQSCLKGSIRINQMVKVR